MTDRPLSDRLALDRTLLAYVRTALGLLAAGAALVHMMDASGFQSLGWVLLVVSPVFAAAGLRRYARLRRTLLVAALGVLSGLSARAQDDPSLRLGTLVQTDVGVGEGADGFALPAVRVRASARVDGVGLFAQADLARDPVLLDARLSVPLVGPLALDAGLFKTPFSREFLTFRGDLPLAERSRVARRLAPGRRLGAALRLPVGGATVHAGLFNDADRTAAPTGALLAVARAEASAERGGVAFRAGTSLATGDRTPVTLGADAELRTGPVHLLADAALARPDSAATWGLGLTGDLRVAGPHHALARLDLLDTPGEAPDARLNLGYAVEARSHVRLLADYGFPARRPDEGALTLRLQLAVR